MSLLIISNFQIIFRTPRLILIGNENPKFINFLSIIFSFFWGVKYFTILFVYPFLHQKPDSDILQIYFGAKQNAMLPTTALFVMQSFLKNPLSFLAALCYYFSQLWVNLLWLLPAASTIVQCNSAQLFIELVSTCHSICLTYLHLHK